MLLGHVVLQSVESDVPVAIEDDALHNAEGTVHFVLENLIDVRRVVATVVLA